MFIIHRPMNVLSSYSSFTLRYIMYVLAFRHVTLINECEWIVGVVCGACEQMVFTCPAFSRWRRCTMHWRCVRWNISSRTWPTCTAERLHCASLRQHRPSLSSRHSSRCIPSISVSLPTPSRKVHIDRCLDRRRRLRTRILRFFGGNF